jgi:hypothetical protein
MLAEMLDKVLLKTLSLFIRLLHIFTSIFILSAVGQFLSDISDTENPVPQRYVAVEAIACAAVLWGAFTSLFTCCAGYVLLQMDIVFDTLFAGAFIACVVLLNDDGMNTCRAFGRKYLFDGDSWFRDCKLIKASYAFSIINLYASFFYFHFYFWSDRIEANVRCRFLFVVMIATSTALYLIRRNENSTVNVPHEHHHHHDKHHSHVGCDHECCTSSLS